MHQIECFGYGFKAEHSRILAMQLTLKKIELLEFDMQIEFIYKIAQYLFMLLLITLRVTQRERKEQRKRTKQR